MNEGFDLLIAGEGSAGCVSAKRADRRLGSTVLLINKSGQ
jgi:choline dehydrogenase-like flavoprotein